MTEKIHVEASNCLFCCSPQTRFWFGKLGENGDFPVRRCGNCRSAMIWPRPSQESMDAYYEGEGYGIASLQDVLELDAGYYPDSRRDAARIVTKIREYAPGERFLDVGGGTGFFSHEAVRQGFEVTALEPNPNSAAVFEQLAGFAPKQQVLDMDFARQHADSMDAVLLSQVLEHICDVEQMVRCLATVLKPGGVAAIAVPHFGSWLSRLQGKGDMYISPPEHVNFFSIAGLDALFLRHGFHRAGLETVSKVPKRKIEERFGMAGKLAWRALHAGLSITDKLGKGMVINAYYRLA